MSDQKPQQTQSGWQRLDGTPIEPQTIRGQGPWRPVGLRPIGQRSFGPRSFGDATIPIGTVEVCPRCEVPRVRGVTEPNADEVQMYFWSDCKCNDGRMQYQADAIERARCMEAARDAALLGDPNLSSITFLRLERFDPHRLQITPDGHPYEVATNWLVEALDAGRSGPDGPPPALWFHCPKKGRGKTHLAAGLLWEAKERGLKRVAFVEEQKFCTTVWSTEFGPRYQALLDLPSEAAWLTVIDDIGRRKPKNLRPGETAEDSGIAKIWNEVISRRERSPGWTIFTSNYTPKQLLERNTIDEATFSRIAGMVRGQLLFFDGTDQRMAHVQRTPDESE